jgi:tRNA pseudouridine38-40 synthase
MRNLKLVVSYDGTDFHGWQTQPQQRTVQETLEIAYHQLTGEKVFANAAGRTDAGVHALGQVVNVRTQTRHPVGVVLRGLNAHLPPDVVVRQVEDAEPDFDACRHAVRKLYRYVLHDGKVPDLFLRRFCWHIPYGKLDDQAMRQAAAVLVGTHDFHSFETEWPNRQSSVRTITRLSVCRLGDLLWIEVEADGFLYNMVRSIVGTLVNIGRGYWPVEKMAEILAAHDRRQAGPTAPPQGLFLVRVEYPTVARPLQAEEKSP